MSRTKLTALCLLALMPLAACKIVKNPDPVQPSAEGQGQAAQTAGSDEARMAARAAELWNPKILPYIAEKATDIATLRAALKDGPDAAASYGFRPAAEGSPWNFIAKGEGKVVAEDRKSRAAKLELDTNGDGAGDVTVQLGPVMKGTTLRDSLNFLVFTDYRDQIEFAKLARALNDHAHAALSLPEGDLTGRNVAFSGAFTIRTKGEAILLTPVTLEVK
ncbi:DUF2291 family protein [Paracoccus sp. NGMCC 1.201697]|uniref:DUF2291 family protein n=1 Tax=Paracoccus broussonetiae subsp. drimophilus TaxID=3373869 RepID=A0ABW7LLP1_9RHOB